MADNDNIPDGGLEQSYRHQVQIQKQNLSTVCRWVRHWTAGNYEITMYLFPAEAIVWNLIMY